MIVLIVAGIIGVIGFLMTLPWCIAAAKCNSKANDFLDSQDVRIAEDLFSDFSKRIDSAKKMFIGLGLIAVSLIIFFVKWFF